MAQAMKEISAPKKPAVTLKAGQRAPDFKLLSDTGKEVHLSDYRGKKVILYFYPKDNTPGCTKESCAFSRGFSQIRRRGAIVLGVSTDSVETHRNFKQKYELTFPLLADENKEVVLAYGVWREKSLYGRKYMGLERTTFVIDEDGKISKIFTNVQVDGHFDEVLEVL